MLPTISKLPISLPNPQTFVPSCRLSYLLDQNTKPQIPRSLFHLISEDFSPFLLLLPPWRRCRR
ncbi:hypothetical protein Hanom_Chr15g01372071 [Helianthus anomalus]